MNAKIHAHPETYVPPPSVVLALACWAGRMDDVSQRFTGWQERDNESLFDWFQTRYTNAGLTAGYTASRSILRRTKTQKIEFGGFIDKSPNGTYSYTPPIAGNRTSLPDFYDQYNSHLQSLSNGYSVTG
jgi:hypothetical protein